MDWPVQTNGPLVGKVDIRRPASGLAAGGGGFALVRERGEGYELLTPKTRPKALPSALSTASKPALALQAYDSKNFLGSRAVKAGERSVP
jgi:hypothetical protein